MRGDIVYHVFGVHAGRTKDASFGTFTTREAAEVRIRSFLAGETGEPGWAQRYHDQGFVIREHVVAVDFEIPARPKPRERYAIQATDQKGRPGTWSATQVEVFRRDGAGWVKLFDYQRNYAMLQTFEPFRQGRRDLALISRSYTKTAVVDLATGEVIAEEIDERGAGFCPVGFYVPDWWDVNSGEVIPGSPSWDADYEWPLGNFGFVWGCHWGDDSSWKVQYLDLSRVQEGVIARSDRFGYVELATHGFACPRLDANASEPKSCEPPSFIRVTRNDGKTTVQFAVEMAFDGDTGKPEEWQRLRIANME